MTTTSLGTLIQSAITIVKDDALSTTMPVITAFFQNISSNPSTSNLTAQLAALEVDLLAALPNLEQAVVKDLAALIQQEVTALAASATPTTAA
jgi:hypothetical protein